MQVYRFHGLDRLTKKKIAMEIRDALRGAGKVASTIRIITGRESFPTVT